jgi:hypothetical protein
MIFFPLNDSYFKRLWHKNQAEQSVYTNSNTSAHTKANTTAFTNVLTYANTML